jgi:hypothetical protein
VCIFFGKLIQKQIKKIQELSKNINNGKSYGQVRVFDVVLNKGLSKVKEVVQICRLKFYFSDMDLNKDYFKKK